MFDLPTAGSRLVAKLRESLFHQGGIGEKLSVAADPATNENAPTCSKSQSERNQQKYFEAYLK